MYKEAETFFHQFKEDPQIKWKLICIWVAISTNYIVLLFPKISKLVGGMIAGILDSELENREELKRGILPKTEGFSGSSSNNPPA